jgi:outer membrane murein-binding lipoprotein Lpp
VFDVRVTGLVAVALAGLLLGGCSDTATLDMDRAGTEIARSLEATYDLDVEQVRCPESVPAEAGRHFTCSVRIAGQPLTVEVRQRGDEGELRVVPGAAVLRVAEVQADLLEQLADRLDDPDARADCGSDAVRVVVPGRSFECRVTTGGTVRVVDVDVRDVDGSLTFRLR